ncbi:histidine kinase N-terminal 7TM domain-containing protein [Halomicrobium sp. LC1Hm]|uniref:histidine kinase N-terminal 7TM domain-containing protein n=1 Tax=Halomicrobium sp. LC1Hm TaxID=2610902 RepID=UPI0012982922|nr:histidine kinase N-terminal 7TM domain-containing protein [Halomicrobium sp. LC1Hm]QGA84010.1 Signal transduction histidine kinase, contains PAS domain [Halomicrobium sp. LC1Hm]
MKPLTRRAVVAGAIVAALVWSGLVPLSAGAAGVSGLDCQPGSEGAVFAADSGLEAVYDGETLDGNPFVDDTTLAFPNVTVSATDTASLRIVAATDDGVCLRSIEPTNAPLRVTPDAGETVVVRDSLVNLSYGSFQYARSAGGVDLSYNASAPAEITVEDGDLSAGRTVEAVDAEDGTQLTTGTVSAGNTVDLQLPAGHRTVDLQYASTQTATATSTVQPAATATPTPTDTATATDTSIPTATTTDTATPTAAATNTATPTPTDTATPTATTTDTATQTATTAGETPPDSDPETGGSSAGDDTATPTPTPDSTRTATETATPANTTEFTVPEWTGELVAYEPTPQTQHVGGLLPLTVSLWGLALWLVVARRGPETRLLALVLVVASVRATSDLTQIVLDGFVGVEAPLATLNLLLEFATAVLFAGFAVQYADLGERRTRHAKRALGVLGAVGATAVLTNPLHGQVFTDAAVAAGPFTYVTASVGPVGWLLFALTTGLVAAGGVLVARTFVVGSPRGAWRPVAVIGTGLAVAVGIAALDVLELGPVTGYDYSATGVNYFLLATTVSLLGYGFQRLKPSGQRSIVADLDDAIVILDDAWRVVEWNGAAEEIVPELSTGRSFDAVFSEPLARPTVDQTVTREMSLQVERWETDREADAEPSTDSDDRTDGDSDGQTAVEATDRAETTDPGANETQPDSAAEAHGEPPETERRHFIVNARAVTTETSNVIGYTVRFADVTALKRHMSQLERRNEQLDQFAGAVTQDLRGPLAEAREETERVRAVLADADDPEAVDRRALTTALGSIDAALNRMAQLVEDILGLARDRELQTDPEPISFDAIVESVWDRFDPEAATLSVEATGEISADREHLDRLLAVLVRNAIQHGGEGVTVRVGLDDDGFYVADDGPGIDSSVRDRAFEAGVTTRDAAAGLGLTMARQRAAAHGWEIALDGDAAGTKIVVSGCETELPSEVADE